MSASARAIRAIHGHPVEVNHGRARAAARAQARAVDLDLELVRQLAAESDRFAEPVHGRAGLELRAQERLLVLRVGHLALEAGEVRELLLAPLARRGGDERVDVVGEELEGP